MLDLDLSPCPLHYFSLHPSVSPSSAFQEADIVSSKDSGHGDSEQGDSDHDATNRGHSAGEFSPHHVIAVISALPQFQARVSVTVNGIMLNRWCGLVTFNFLNLRVCESSGSGVLAGMNGPRGVDCVSHPGEKQEYLGKSFCPVFPPLAAGSPGGAERTATHREAG